MPKSIKKPNKHNKSSSKIYLDYASGVSANPGSIHKSGVEAKIILEEARTKVAEVLVCRREEVIFTSGGTEGNNLAIAGAVWAWKKNILPHIVTTNIEHSSVLETCKLLEKRKLAEITFVPVESSGIVDSENIKKAIKKNTLLVSVMYANNEIGTIQPIREIAKCVRHHNKRYGTKVLFHTDAVQAVNYLNLNVERLGVDLLTLSGAKIEGSGRAGALYKKANIILAPLFGGGNQEAGLRPGTENLPSITKFAEALLATQNIKEKESARLEKLRDYFISKLNYSGILENTRIIVNGDLRNRLPNNVSITVPKIPSDLLVLELNARGIEASSKSACKSGDGKASHVIQALRGDLAETDGSIRFSFGRDTSKGDIDITINALKQILTKLKKWY
ncbi:MAG: cysteine desulfurase family protein [Candidatus Paceibacterota bacterium]